jgi:hypothetical protein
MESTSQKYWTIPRCFEGESVLIIGGGHSLEGFDWCPFHRWNVIGCNDAYLLGPWVDVVVSGDNQWMEKHTKTKEYRDFEGLKVTIAPGWGPARDGRRTMVPKRLIKGMSTRQWELGWNDSTGAAAIDLALKMGAMWVFLLGYDMKLAEVDGGWRNNWHENNLDVPNPDVFPRHKNGMERVRAGAAALYPNAVIYNAGPDSDLDCWPRIDHRELTEVVTV